MCMHAQFCLTHCNPMDCSMPGSSVHGILQARIPVWVAISSSRRSSQPHGLNPSSASPVLASRLFTTEPPGKPMLGYILLDGKNCKSYLSVFWIFLF